MRSREEEPAGAVSCGHGGTKAGAALTVRASRTPIGRRAPYRHHAVGGNEHLLNREQRAPALSPGRVRPAQRSRGARGQCRAGVCVCLDIWLRAHERAHVTYLKTLSVLSL